MRPEVFGSRPIGASIGAAARRRPPVHERHVLALDAACAQHVGELACAHRVAREHEQAGRVAIEAVDDAGTLGILAAGDAVREQPVHERRLAQPRRGMRDEPRGLVDDEQVVVLEHHVEPQLDRLEARPRILQRDLDLLAPAQAQGLARDRARRP